MCYSLQERRVVKRAKAIALHLEHCNITEEIDFEGKRLNILLGCLHHDCHCEHCIDIAKAYSKSRLIYQAHDINEAHVAAHEVVEILNHVA